MDEDAKPIVNAKGFFDAKKSDQWVKGTYSRSHFSGPDIKLSSGGLKEKIQKIYNAKTNYIFIGLQPNIFAVNELPNWVKTKPSKEFYSTGEFRKFNKRKDDDGNRLSFSESLKETYFSTIDTLIKKEFGGSSHIRYPLLETKGDAYLPQVKNWPMIYVLKGDLKEPLIKIVQDLNSNETYEVIKKIEGMWKYRLAQVDVLRKKHINPLVIGDDGWEVDADTLRNAVNFLIPFKLSEKERVYYDGDL